MKTSWMVLAAVLVGLLALGARTANGTGAEAPRVVVGTFDSRAVAVAYVRSEAFAEELRGLHAELAAARAAGDEARVAELEVLGPRLQERAHRQGFGMAPVDDLLAGVADELPRLASEAGVDVIVSKWALAYRSEGARFVDVTDRMAELFEPDEATRATIRELLRTPPVPAERLATEH